MQSRKIFFVLLIVMLLLTCSLFSMPVFNEFSTSKSPLIFISGGTSVQFQQNSQEIVKEANADELMQQGYSYFGDEKYSDALDYYQRALHMYRDLTNKRKIANCLLNIGIAHYFTDNHAQAIVNYKEALDILRDVDEPQLKGESKRYLGWAYFNQENYKEAIWQFDDARKIFQIILKPVSEADCAWGKALAVLNSAEYDQAVLAFEEAGKLFQRSDNPAKHAKCVYYQGYAFYQAEQCDQAIPYLQQAIKLFQSQKDSSGLSDTYGLWANSLYNRGRYLEAIKIFERALEMHRQRSDVAEEADCLDGLGNSHFQLKEYDVAAKYFGNAAPLFQSLGKFARSGSSFLMQAHSLFNYDQFDRAIESYQNAIGIFSQNIDWQKEEAECWQGKADAHKNLDQYELAINSYLKAIDLFQSVLNQGKIADCFQEIGDCYFALENYEKARQYYHDAETKFHIIGKLAREAACIESQADCYLNLSLYQEACARYKSATEIYHQLQDWKSKGNSHFNWAKCLQNIQKYNDALAQYREALASFTTIDEHARIAKCHLKIGAMLQKLNSLPEAEQELQNALSICDAIKDQSCMADIYSQQGELFRSLAKQNNKDAEQYRRKAEQSCLKARDLYTAVGDSLGFATSLEGLGGIYFDQEKYTQAMTYYNQALAVYSLLNDQENEAMCNYNLGSLHFNLNNYSEAQKFFEASLSLYQQLNLKSEIANSLSMLGHTYLSLKPPRLEDARKNLQSALSLYQALAEIDPGDQAFCYRGIGEIYAQQGQFAEAKTQYQKALELYNKTIDPRSKGYCQLSLGEVEALMANFQEALSWYNSAGAIFQDNMIYRGVIYSNIMTGKLYYDQDQYETALTTFEKALRLAKEYNDEHYQLICYIDMGNIYNQVEVLDSAEIMYLEGEQLANKLDDTTNRGICLVNLGNIFYDRGNYVKAQEYCENALKIAREQEESTFIITSLINLGNIFCRRELIEKGAQYYLEALQISERIKFPKGQGLALNNLASIDVDRGNYSDALIRFNQAERILAENYIRRILFTVYSNKGVVYEKFEQYQQAYDAYNAAIEIAEDIRAGLKRERLLRSFIESKADLYDRAIILLVTKLNDIRKAAEYLERSKHFGLQEHYRQIANKAHDEKLLALIDQYDHVKNQLDQLQRKLEESGAGAQKEMLSKLITDKKSEANILAEKLGEGVGIRVKLLQGLQQEVPPDAIFVMYHPSRTGLFIFLATNDNFQVREVPITKNDLNAKIKAYRDFIGQGFEESHAKGNFPVVESWQDRNVQSLKDVSMNLYQYLIAPIENFLDGKKMITIIPSEQLYYIPIHALARQSSTGTIEFVIERFNVNYLSSIGFLNLVKARNRSQSPDREEHIVALANADGTLPKTEDEVRSVQLFVPDAEIFIGKNATEEIAVQKSRDCSTLILSTHCNLNNQNPNQTFVQLAASGSYDGRWHVGEVQEISCPNLNLVILSACQTAIGQENPGLEVCTFAESFSAAGASSIIATLWPVSEFSSFELMKHFFQFYFKEKLPKAEALRQAQLALLKDVKYRHPLNWAPFILMGDWR
ncbi:tetratricopeptide repeat protein [candidate division KSB1 bacterium]|nr:tetratricopeptide repeat protein [candidate division KSB1 bacterium]